MKTISIALPESLESFVEEQLAGGAYVDVGDYMQALVRFHGFMNYLIFYRPIPDGIELLRILHGARDTDRILRDEQ